MSYDYFREFEKLFANMTLALFVCVPLALWKVIEIIIWICSHLKVSWS